MAEENQVEPQQVTTEPQQITKEPQRVTTKNHQSCYSSGSDRWSWLLHLSNQERRSTKTK